MAIVGYNGSIKTAGITTTFSTSESFSNVSGNIYQIDDITKSVWDRTVVPTVYRDGVAETPSAIDYLFGTVTLSTTGTVTASGNYLPMSEKTGFTEHSLTLGGEVEDVTTYDNNAGFYRRQQTLLDVSMTIGGFQNPWFYDYTDTTKNLSEAISATVSTFSIGAGSGVVAGNEIRIEDEIMLVAIVSGASSSELTVTRGKAGSVAATHSSDADVFTMTFGYYSRNSFMVELMPNGSTNDIWRGWFKIESKEHSGSVTDLERNTISLQGDGNSAASFKHNIN